MAKHNLTHEPCRAATDTTNHVGNATITDTLF